MNEPFAHITAAVRCGPRPRRESNRPPTRACRDLGFRPCHTASILWTGSGEVRRQPCEKGMRLRRPAFSCWYTGHPTALGFRPQRWHYMALITAGFEWTYFDFNQNTISLHLCILIYAAIRNLCVHHAFHETCKFLTNPRRKCPVTLGDLPKLSITKIVTSVPLGESLSHWYYCWIELESLCYKNEKSDR